MKTIAKLFTLAIVTTTSLVSAYIAIDYINFCRKQKKKETEEDVMYVSSDMDNIDIEI